MVRVWLAILVVAAACSSSGDKPENNQPEYAESTNPIVNTRLQARVDNIKYQRGVTLITNLERIASYGEVGIPVCLEGLKSENAMTRMGCAWVLGRIGDTRTIPQVQELLEDKVDFVRYEAASQLGTLGSRAGYRVLVEGLSHERLEYRYKCFEALRDLSGQTFGYSHNAAPEVRIAAVAKWEAWLEKIESEEV